MSLVITVHDTADDANDIEYRQLAPDSSSWQGTTVHGQSYLSSSELLFELAADLVNKGGHV